MEHLPEELLRYGKKVLLVYGGGTISGPKELAPDDVEKIYQMCMK